MSALLHLGVANAVCAAALALVAWATGRYGRRSALAYSLRLLVLLNLVTPPLFPLTLRGFRQNNPRDRGGGATDSAQHLRPDRRTLRRVPRRR